MSIIRSIHEWQQKSQVYFGSENPPTLLFPVLVIMYSIHDIIYSFPYLDVFYELSEHLISNKNPGFLCVKSKSKLSRITIIYTIKLSNILCFVVTIVHFDMILLYCFRSTKTYFLIKKYIARVLCISLEKIYLNITITEFACLDF